MRSVGAHAGRAPGLGPELRAVDAALARFPAPAGWRVLRTSGRLEAHWSSPTGTWARYSVRLEASAGGDDDRVLFRRAVAGGQLTVTFASSDLSPETVAAASALLTPLQFLLARAVAS